MALKNKTDNLGKIPPQDLNIEEAVLGSLMLESDAIHKVSGILTAESFYKDAHRMVFEAVKSLSDQNKPIDLITVTKFLKDKSELEKVGGPIFITQLTSRVASAAHIEYHAKIIQQLHIQRELIKMGSETITEAFEDGAEIEDLINSAKQKISSLEDCFMGSNTGQSHADVFQDMIMEIETDCNEANEGKQPGITTGIKILNNATGGWRNTNLIIIAARPSVGKTSLALHFAKMAAMSGKWVNFYSLEMRPSDLLRIMTSGQSGINRSNLRDGRINDNDWNTLNVLSGANFGRLPIIWNSESGLTANRIKSLTIRNRKAGKCDLVIIDYIGLIKPFDKKAIREQQISEISRTLKEIALCENIPVICLSQLNRQAANVKPELHMLRESGSIEQDADIVIMPWVENARYQLAIEKNRRGIKGTFEIFANDEMTVFGDVDQEAFTASNPDKNSSLSDITVF
ncbi:MAG: replicative DNA helicase [Mariniphaga sp.]|nr:replicative DNA helicase [Mariniphaga sp.]